MSIEAAISLTLKFPLLVRENDVRCTRVSFTRPLSRRQLQHKSRGDCACSLIRNSTLSSVTGHDPVGWGSNLGKCTTFLFSDANTSAQGLTELHIEIIARPYYTEYRDRSVKLITHLHLLLRLGMQSVLSPLPVRNVIASCFELQTKTNSVACRPQANYTDRATDACRRT
jgi:hypothetical protein